MYLPGQCNGTQHRQNNEGFHGDCLQTNPVLTLPYYRSLFYMVLNTPQGIPYQHTINKHSIILQQL